MYANQLYALLKLDRVASRYFLGVFSCDKLLNEHFPKKECFVIVNTAPSNKNGEHWILLYNKKSKTIIFDSLAKKHAYYGMCFLKAVHHFSQHTKTVVSMKKSIQSESSVYCGLFCLYVAHQLARRKSINTILSKFSKNNKKDNDAKILILVQKLFFKWKKSMEKYVH